MTVSVARKLYLAWCGIASKNNSDWSNPLEVLRARWGRVPSNGRTQLRTDELCSISDSKLVQLWEETVKRDTTGKGFNVRGWYHKAYKWQFNGKNILDVGSGFGLDGITFAQNGAKVTFCDIVPSNLEVLKRICQLKGVEASFCYMDNIEALSRLTCEFDVVWCQGSLINAPFDVMREERQELVKHLKVGGRWIELAYPKSRWERDGRPPLHIWGEITDGKGTPWMEWYDLPKLLLALEPCKFRTVSYLEFHNGDFNWFELEKQ